MFALTLQTQNAAFDPPQKELARILHELADKITTFSFTGHVYDINGNRVGNYVLTKD